MKIKIDYISDTHLSMSDNIQLTVKALLPDKPADILLLAGDIAEDISIVEEFINVLKYTYRYIFYVNGNHEMYMQKYDKLLYDSNSWKKLEKLRENLSKYENVFYLDGFQSPVVLKEYNDLTIGGLCMWWGNNEEIDKKDIQLYKKALNDYNYISFNGSLKNGLKKLDTKKLFKRYYGMFKKIDSSDVLLTHFAPIKIPEHLLPVEYDSTLNKFFYFDGRDILKRIKPKVCVFGHTHTLLDFKYDNIRMLCNTLGYPHERKYTSKIKTFYVTKD